MCFNDFLIAIQKSNVENDYDAFNSEISKQKMKFLLFSTSTNTTIQLDPYHFISFHTFFCHPFH